MQEVGLGDEYPISIMCDNISSLKLVHNPIMLAQTKHIDLHNHYIREKYEDGSIQVRYILSAEQQADLLTKPLPPQSFIRNREVVDLKMLSVEILCPRETINLFLAF